MSWGSGATVSWAERSWGAVPVPSYQHDDLARYQQQQLADKEKRLLQVYAEQRAQQERAFQRVSQAGNAAGSLSYSHGSAGSSSSNASQSSQSSLPCGKVRQLFEGRRNGQHGAGRDRGAPLAPLEGRTRAPALGFATRSNSNVNLSQTYHFGQHHRYPPRGHSLDRDLRHRQGDWALRGRQRDYASDSSDGGESPPPYDRDIRDGRDGPHYHEDFRILNRLPNVGGALLSQSQPAMAPPGRLSAPGTVAGRRPPGPAASNENAPPPPRPGATSRLPGPAARKPLGGGVAGAAAPRVAPLRPSSGQRSAPTPTGPAAPAAVQPATGLARAPARAPVRAAATRNGSTAVNAVSNGVARATPATTATSRVPASPQRMAGARAAPSSGGASTPRGAQGGGVAAPQKDDGLVSCPVCSRRFLPDRVAKHQEICNRSTHKKRKVFDPVAARVKGTEAESYVRRAKNAPEPKALKNSNWRRKHEDFIQTIRAAKQVQSHIASGGKLSDLPPPPPSDYSDYVPCPHCGRKFNQTAADRHIPKCATMLHNKSKPGLSKSTVGKGAASRR
ncbi:protein transport protein sec31-like [Thrips palmi]|uniref:Protein transport protein sec31-like n=1 Tax=Thrips palmi TaxID=161013 RepID=A0A6P8YMR9_THRPL|nr:protein transport protein sec31-like [Thrips palmi]